MTTEPIADVVSAARTELRATVEGTAPDFTLLARRSRRRRQVWSGALVVLAVAAVAIPAALRSGDTATNLTTRRPDGVPGVPVTGSDPVGTGSSANADLLVPGETRHLAASPLAGRSTMAAVWTGRDMVVWGGDGPSGPFDDGAAYDPREDRWSMLPDAPLTARNAPAAVWTGTEVLLWGGSSPDADHRDGAAYDPEAHRWRSIAPAPFPSAGRPVGVWTGSEMVVMAGFNSTNVAAYDPVRDRWRAIPDLPGRLLAPSPVATWTGRHLVTVIDVGGFDGPKAERIISLDLVDGDWSTVSEVAPGAVVLGGSEGSLVVAAGEEAFEVSGTERRPIATIPSGIQVDDAPAVWTGHELVQWAGNKASVIDPVAGTWEQVPSGVDTHRIQPALVWADGVLIGWGGFADFATGAMIRLPK